MLKKSRIFLIVICLILSGCTVPIAIPVLPTETEVIPTVPTATEEFSLDATQWLSTVFAYSTTTPTPVSPLERPPITSDLVKNVEPAIALSLNESEEIKGLPDDVSPAWAEKLKAYYQAVKSLYPTSEVLLDVDSTSNSQIIIIVMGDTIYYQIIKNPNGDNTYPIFPTSFETGEAGLILSGDYKPVKVPNTSIGVVWFEGIPQLLANYVELPDGNSYFTHYMDYSGVWSYDAYPWKDVSGVKEEMASFPPIELEIEPIYTQITSYKYLGVMINAEIIIDKSYSSQAEKITIPDSVFAEYIARLFFDVWWNRQKKYAVYPTEYDFVNYMESWSDAQSSNDFEKWRSVLIEDIWANDLTDGLGYQQKPYDILLMCDNLVAEGLLPINKVSIVFTGYGNEKNVTSITGDPNIMLGGQGTNIERNRLFLFYYSISSHSKEEVNRYWWNEVQSQQLAFLDWYLINNKGQDAIARSSSYYDSDLWNLLYKGGFRIE